MSPRDRWSGRRWPSWALGVAASSLAVTPLELGAYPIKAPWRGDSLPQHTLMQTGGHGGYECPGRECAMDMAPVRWDPDAGAFRALKTGDGPRTPETPLDQMVGYGMPLVSPVDGEVIGCWRRMPDDGPGGAEPAQCLTQDGGGCSVSGNFVLIRTFDGHLFYAAHMQADSVPDWVCPTDEELVPARFADRPCAEGAPFKGLRTDVLLEEPLPLVLEGDLIGRLGNSGGTRYPHVHVAVYTWMLDSNGDHCVVNVPYEFMETWQQARGDEGPRADGWAPLRGERPQFDGTAHLLWPDPVGPRVDERGLAPGSSQALALTAGGGVVVHRDAQGRLAARSLVIGGGGALELGAERSDEQVRSVDVAAIDRVGGHVVAAARDRSDRLRMVPFWMGADGELVKGVVTVEPTISARLVAITRAPTHAGVVVAVQNETGELSLVDYGSLEDGTVLSLARRGVVSTADDIVELDVATIDATRGAVDPRVFHGVVSAERRADDSVWLRTWAVGTAGTIDAAGSLGVREIAGDGPWVVRDIDLAVTGEARQFAVVSAIGSVRGDLRIAAYSIDGEGALTLVDQLDDDEGAVVGLSSARAGREAVIVGARRGAGGTTLISLNVGPGGELRRSGTVDAGAVDSLVVDARHEFDDIVALVSEAGVQGALRYRTNYRGSAGDLVTADGDGGCGGCSLGGEGVPAALWLAPWLLWSRRRARP